ncbi:MAG TPA: carboxypeptidase regulatory-like domain-containing protein [Terriglobales bacterium]
MIRHLVVAFACIAATAISLAQAPGKSLEDPDKAKKPPGNCTVSGRVVGATDGAPLRSARVGLIQTSVQRHPLVYATTTDNEGRFEIKQIEAGRYEFFASHVGYLEQYYQAKSTNEDGALLSLASGLEISDVLFRLVRAAVITGKVVDDTGEPMVGVSISVLGKLSTEDLEEAGPRARKQELISVSAGLTDDRGEYRIFGLKHGEYYVKAAATADPPIAGRVEMGSNWILLHQLGSQYAPLYYPGVLPMDQAQAVTLSAGEEAQADFAMRRIKVVQVSGRVIGVDGSPATHAYAALSVPNVNDWGDGLGTSVDSRGEFSIKGVPPGSYVLTVRQNDEGQHSSARQKVEVGEESIDSIVIAIGRGAKLHGYVTASVVGTAALDRVYVVLGSTSEDEAAGGGFAEVKKDGTFELDGLPDGSYSLNAFGLEPGWFVKSAHLGNDDVFQKGVQIENGAVAGRVDIVISNDGAQIEGAVTESDKNQPLAGVRLLAKPEPETDYDRFRSPQGVTDQNGHFLLKDVPPGNYKVSAKMPSPGGSTPAIKSEPVAVRVGEREHRALDIQLKVPNSE